LVCPMNSFKGPEILNQTNFLKEAMDSTWCNSQICSKVSTLNFNLKTKTVNQGVELCLDKTNKIGIFQPLYPRVTKGSTNLMQTWHRLRTFKVRSILKVSKAKTNGIIQLNMEGSINKIKTQLIWHYKSIISMI
jgi:hypothetical protein